MLIRFSDRDGRIGVGLRRGDAVHPLDARTTIGAVLAATPADRARLLAEAGTAPAVAVGDVRLLAPIDGRTEVWACGVTYRRSRDARAEESEASQDVYERVYDAVRPEVFFKSAAWRVIGPGGTVTIRRDARITVPEPELAVVVSPDRDVVGYTICNDMSSRDIEGENPLYLPQAKLWLGGCAVGPGIVLAEDVPDPYDLGVELTVSRGGRPVFSGTASTSQLHRRIGELVDAVFADNPLPEGAVLATGTGIVPDLSFTLQPGDDVSIRIDRLGTLRTGVGLGWQAATVDDPGLAR